MWIKGVRNPDKSGFQTPTVLHLMLFCFVFQGRVGVDPQTRGSEDHPVVVFSLATNHRFKRDDEFVTSTDWHNVAVFKPSLRMSVEQNVTKGKKAPIN